MGPPCRTQFSSHHLIRRHRPSPTVHDCEPEKTWKKNKDTASY